MQNYSKYFDYVLNASDYIKVSIIEMAINIEAKALIYLLTILDLIKQVYIIFILFL